MSLERPGKREAKIYDFAEEKAKREEALKGTQVGVAFPFLVSDESPLDFSHLPPAPPPTDEEIMNAILHSDPNQPE